MATAETLLKETNAKMDKSMEFMHQEFAGIRTGRASTALVERITVDYYGSQTPVNQVANISVPESRQLMITPYDRNMMGAMVLPQPMMASRGRPRKAIVSHG